ncbi:MAG: ATP-binding cassette domain-containing protein [Eubacteriales bacterium]|nr:ATP-binding cassette domain-containing protein [Eubacteriales bacterium]
MGWFDEQIKERKENDEAVFSETFANLASSVIGKKISASMEDDRKRIMDAMNDIMKYYHAKPREIPDNLKDKAEQMEYLLRPYGIMRRTVRLTPGWYKDATGAMLGTLREGGFVAALIPGRYGGYRYRDPKSGAYVKLDKKREKLFEEEAICFYKPFPLAGMEVADFFRFLWESLSASDFVLFFLAGLLVVLLGMITPVCNHIIFSEILDSGKASTVLAMAVFMISASVSKLLAEAMRALFLMRIQTKMKVPTDAAGMMRLLSLPADFFKRYSAGELADRMQKLGLLCELLAGSVFSVGLTVVFSVVYMTQIAAYAPKLALPSAGILVMTTGFSVLTALLQIRISKKRIALGARESGLSYSLISGIQKIRLSGSEKRAFARWGNLYAEEAALLYNPPLLLKLNPVLHMAITLSGTILLNYLALSAGIALADYYAFHVAYGMISGAFASLASIAPAVADIRVISEMSRPFFETEPEISQEKPVVSRLMGGIEINNVSFRYREEMPDVLKNMNLKIRSGEYVAIVGTTGCGKSTLMRLLLGFERPQKGAVYYDGKDLNRMDLKSLRQKIGVVMQEGKLFQGDIFSNITISVPHATLEDAWEAARLAGIAEDIQRMPMGMFTLLSEGSGDISGGQRQRILIARALAARPRILMFDEATSALDNVTQKIVSDSLEQLKCTRIVIAHRLSTIKNCDRILVLDQGKVAEEGTYGQLIEKNGIFADLVKKQRLDVSS